MPDLVTDRERIRRLIEDEDAQVVDVLPRPEYEYAHLPGAVHVPLKSFDPSDLDRARPVVVYCNDFLCDMSPRAAWRLEALGFTEVYDYVPGKVDWLAYDLPYEGEAVLTGLAVDREVPTCRLGEPISEVRERLPDSGGPCIALNEARIVMGVVQPEGLEATLDAPVEKVMQFGTTTIRPSEDLETLLERMRHADVGAVLVGILHRHEAERLLEDGS